MDLRTRSHVAPSRCQSRGASVPTVAQRKQGNQGLSSQLLWHATEASQLCQPTASKFPSSKNPAAQLSLPAPLRRSFSIPRPRRDKFSPRLSTRCTSGSGGNSPMLPQQFTNNRMTCDSGSLVTIPNVVRPVKRPRDSGAHGHRKKQNQDDSYGLEDVPEENLLPTIADSRSPTSHHISPETVSQLLQGAFAPQIASHILVDCRYPYEFEGGHIQGAKNLYTRQMVRDFFFPGNVPLPLPPTTVIIFHCEFSSVRGPAMRGYLRELDRMFNSHFYPRLSFPHTFIMSKGFKAFHSDEERRNLYCTTPHYVTMDSQPLQCQRYRKLARRTRSLNDKEQSPFWS
eukprot:m.29668 g.29668  ORF g.29668 m.29668 type:complete len:342 (+) comp14394_c0_seq1:281-1306(+)